MAGVRLGSLPDNTEQALRFVQDRLALFAKVTFLITCTFLVVSSAADFLRGVSRMSLGGRASHVLASVIALVLWQVLRRSRHFEARTLQRRAGIGSEQAQRTIVRALQRSSPRNVAP